MLGKLFQVEDLSMAQTNHRQKTDADHNATTNRLNAMSVKVG